MDLDQARRLKDLRQENARLKRTVADLTLDHPHWPSERTPEMESFTRAGQWFEYFINPYNRKDSNEYRY